VFSFIGAIINKKSSSFRGASEASEPGMTAVGVVAALPQA
jgi:hypothetical protein